MVRKLIQGSEARGTQTVQWARECTASSQHSLCPVRGHASTVGRRNKIRAGLTVHGFPINLENVANKFGCTYSTHSTVSHCIYTLTMDQAQYHVVGRTDCPHIFLPSVIHTLARERKINTQV